MLRRRLLLCCVIVVLLGGLFVHNAATFEEHTRYPTVEELDADYDSYLGQEVSLAGRVVAVSPGNETVTIEQRGSPMLGAMTVTGVERSVNRGGSVHVYGTLEPNHTIAAANVVVINTSAGAELYKYAASAVGAILVLGAFFREWGFDRETMTFEERDDG